MAHRLSRLLQGGLPLLVLLWLGSAQSENPAASSSQARQAKIAAQARENERRSAVIVSFAEGRIDVAEIEDAIAKQLPVTRRQLAAPGGRKPFLEQLVRYDLLVLEAKRRGYHEHPLVIEAGKRAAIEALQRELAVDPATIAAEDVAQFYEQHKRELSRPLLRRASQIELATETEARAAIAALKGADRLRFAQFARERSQDARTARQGGELGYFAREGSKPEKDAPSASVPQAVVEAVFALERVGQVSTRPVRQERGFSVVMLTGEMPAMAKSRAKAERGIREQLAAQLQARALDQRLAKLEAEHKPELHPELLDAIVLEPAKPLDIPEGFPAAPPDPRAPPRLVKPDEY